MEDVMRVYIPTTSAEDWKQLLADPEKHWRDGFSAHALATCWQAAQGFPVEVERLFKGTPIDALQNIHPLLGFPEYRVQVPGRGRDS
jgi:hypothetical protein